MALYTETYTTPLTGAKLAKLKAFLAAQQLEHDNGVTYTTLLTDDAGAICATGSLEGNVLKCIAIDETYRGEGLLSNIMTALISHAFLLGNKHLFLFTKPENAYLFFPYGFYSISKTDKMLLMENKKDGILTFLHSLQQGSTQGTIGAIVANCNPFTLGHQYLIEQAAARCDTLHLFILSEDKSLFSNEVRYRLALQGTAHLSNVLVHPTADYLVSSVTFPTYFLKEQDKTLAAACQLDLQIFCDYFSPYFHIKTRFVGEEPYCPITRQYNEQMKAFLPTKGISVVEIPRKAWDGQAISASRVRQLMAEQRYDQIKALVPPTTYDYLLSDEGLSLFR